MSAGSVRRRLVKRRNSMAELEKHTHGLDPELPFLTTKFEWVVQWARRSAIWPAQFGLACCAIEMMSMATSRYDVARFGAEEFAWVSNSSLSRWRSRS